jgi:pyridoxal phosphate enzyme (YggS family)
MIVEALKARLLNNFKSVEDRIAEACARAGRERSEITLMAVSKTVDARMVTAAYSLGQLDFGENYVRDAKSKRETVLELGADGVRFHMIGHLQRNKVKDAVHVFDSLHSLDSTRLLEALEKRLSGMKKDFPCFIEVNVSREESKYGVSSDKVLPLVEAALEAQAVRVVGLMTMAPYGEDPEKVRPVFSALRELRDRTDERLGRNVLQYLSMGMTNDFEVAIEEGATHLRIGTALFGS